MMDRRDFLRNCGWGVAVWVIAACSSFALSSATEPLDGKKWNFVFILVDDLGWRDLACLGSDFYKTPNMDRLASQGMKLTKGYSAAPVCSPTRASIMTGKYPARTGVTGVLPGQGVPLHPREVTIAERLKEAGYATASIGKWHLGGQGMLPQDQGFDVNIGGGHMGASPNFFYPGWNEPSNPASVRGGVGIKDGELGEYLTDRLGQEAANFIDGHKDRPFFVYLAHYAVHTPIQAKTEMIREYRKNSSPRYLHRNPIYAAMVESVDQSVGRVMKKLEEHGLTDRTMIIITSDNGGLSQYDGPDTPATYNEPLFAGKGHLYEGGIRVPLIVYWPGVTKPGSSSDVAVLSNDFYPTMLEVAGLKPDPQNQIDGRSLVPLLTQSGSIKREALYWHYPFYDIDGAKPGGAIRHGDFKLIEFYNDGHLELYNLKEDIGETTNLVGRQPGKARAMHRMLDGWRKSLGVTADIRSD